MKTFQGIKDNASLTVKPHRTERDIVFRLRRQAVFAFIASHLNNGIFSESDEFIANAMPGTNRLSIQRIRQSLEKSGDVMIVEKDRRDAEGHQLPNRVRPASFRTFWVREWYRNGHPDLVTLSPSREHGQSATSRTRMEPYVINDLPQEFGALAHTDKTRVREHKNNILDREQPESVLKGCSNAVHCAASREHGFTKYLDSSVQRALTRLRGELAAARAKFSMFHESTIPANLKAEAQRITEEIVILEGGAL